MTSDSNKRLCQLIIIIFIIIIMIINVTMRILSAIFYANLSQLFFSFMEENLADKWHRFCPS